MSKKVIGLFKDELGEKIMNEFCGLRAKTYTNFTDDNNEKKKTKGIKMCVIKRNFNENKTGHNKNWPYTPDQPYRILKTRGSGSGKTNVLLNLIENQPDIDKIYLYAKDPYESKYQYLINKREGVGINHFNDPKAFIEYSNDMCNVYKNINYYNPDTEIKY